MTSGDRLPVIVVGAGLAGLTCARLLAQAGTPVVVLEAADGIGGRVRTDVTPEGFVLDRGFQVVFTAYPALRRVLDLRTLDLRPFDNGAAVVTPAGPCSCAIPCATPDTRWRPSPHALLTWGDRARLARLAISLAAARWDGVRDVPDTGSLRRAGAAGARLFGPVDRGVLSAVPGGHSAAPRSLDVRGSRAL